MRGNVVRWIPHTKGQWCGKRVHIMTSLRHDDVIKWKHFPRYWPFVRGIHRSPVNSPHKGHWRGALMFSSIGTWINDWANSREAGDLRRHRAHCDVIVKNSPYSLLDLTKVIRPINATVLMSAIPQKYTSVADNLHPVKTSNRLLFNCKSWISNLKKLKSWIDIARTDDYSLLVQVMAWCRQATSHYQNQYRTNVDRHMVALGQNELPVSRGDIHSTLLL